MKLGIILLYYKQAPADPKNNKKLFTAYHQYIRSNFDGPKEEDEHKTIRLLTQNNPKIYEDWLNRDDAWQRLLKVFELQSKAAKDCYSKYRAAIEKAETNQLIQKH